MTTVRGAGWLAVLAVVSVAVYALLVMVPYFVNDLDRLPLAEVGGGYHDPKDLWPATLPYVGGWAHLFGILSAIFVPATLLCVAFTCGFSSVWAIVRKAWSVAVAHAVVTVLCAVTTAWFFSPFAQALGTWQMD